MNNKVKTGFLSGHFSRLLTSLVLLFLLRPYTSGLLYRGGWHTLLTFVFISSIFHANHNKKIKTVSISLAIPSVILFWTDLFFPSKTLFALATILTAAFMFMLVYSIMKRVLLEASVTLETLRGAICAYLLIAFAFACIYTFIEVVFPGSFSYGAHSLDLGGNYNFFSWILYFSFVTLLTIGYGDLTPLNSFSQSFSILEGIVGQFYVAMLVSRLIAVYSPSSKNNILKSQRNNRS